MANIYTESRPAEECSEAAWGDSGKDVGGQHESQSRPKDTDAALAQPAGNSEKPAGQTEDKSATKAEPVPAPARQADSQGDKTGESKPRRRGTPQQIKGKLADQKQKIKTKAKPPGGFDTEPLPRAQLGYTVKFTFHKAANLPAADLATASADPYLVATLYTSTPKRHRDDPDLAHRTPTIHKSLEPEWECSWIVANVPPTGFVLSCRLLDEDENDHDDRLGNVTIRVLRLDEKWEGIPAKEYRVKKRKGSKRAYLVKGIISAVSKMEMTPTLTVSVEVLGKSEPPHGQVYTVGPTIWIKHFSPMIGRLARTKVHKNETDDIQAEPRAEDKKAKEYDFQANEIQLSGPVPPKLYHRYVEFRPIIGRMFSSHGLRGRILNKALHKQHNRIYHFGSSTEYGAFEPHSEEAAVTFLRMAHFDEGGRIFTYVLTLDGLLRFTETGPEFGIDLLSKHTMHSDVARYIACSGEFFIRRLEKPDASSDPDPDEATHPDAPVPGGPPTEPPPTNPNYYQLVIDNDSGTYRPDKSILPELQEFLERNLPGMGVVAMHWEEEELKKMKDAQRKVKKEEGKTVNMVLNHSPSASSLGSHGGSQLDDMDAEPAGRRAKTKHERVFEVVAEPKKLKGILGAGARGKA